MSGIPVVITNAGSPVTNGALGIPVTLVGGTAAVVTDDLTVTAPVDGIPKNVTFTVDGGVITAITTEE